MTLNVKKCSYLAPPKDDTVVRLRREEVLRLDRYIYLGFPIIGIRIDFEEYLASCLDRALGCTTFLMLYLNC